MMKDLPLKERLSNMRARLVVLCVVDGEGNRVFDDSDIEALGKKSGKVLTRLSDAIQLINAVGDNEVEEIAKN